VTSIGVLPPDVREQMRRQLKELAATWQERFYRHEILLARTVRGMQIEAQQEFDRAVVNPLLKAIGGTLATFTPRGSDLIPEAFPEIAALQREIAATVQQGSNAVRKLTETRMQEIAAQEVRFTTQSLIPADAQFGAFPEPVQAVQQAVAQRPWLGDSTERWFAKMLQGPTADSVRAWVNTGIQQGLTTDEIVRGLRGTKEQTGILSDKPLYAVAALVRTAATHASTVGRNESYKALGATHYRFVATLDSKTSIQCASLDGQTFPLGKGPVPPLHPNCRSSTVPIFDPGEPMQGDRATIDGPVPADQTFRQWLEGRSMGEQNEVLGRTKAEAWRSGKLSIDQMLGADLQPLTLAELREMDRL
jgi:SPP1 gp7 family putative phage head morphogenesis protein